MTVARGNTRTITVHVPMTFSLRGGRKMIFSEFALPTSRPRTDNALLKAIARAHRWRQQIESGEYASVTELARAERVNESYACRILRLTLLAPSIVTEILNGEINSRLTLNSLTKPLPTQWSDQLIELKLDVINTGLSAVV
jgi:hypothetical protein